MRRGTTTMKMINSTSTTSTSGVILISDCRPESTPPLLSCMMSLSPRACALCDQPDAAEPGFFDSDHGVANLAEVQSGIATNHNPWIRLITDCSAERVAELCGNDLLIVDPHD